MRQAMVGGAAVVVLLCLGGTVARAGADPAVLTVAYGNGVHAFHAGDFQGSYDELAGVIEAGSNDPRVYYFRGLAALKLGRMDEAEADFQQGATLEAEGRGPVSGHAISRALERVQGCDRLKLEQYRSRARIALAQRGHEATRRRYSGIEDVEADVLRRRRPERLEPAESVAKPLPRGGAIVEEPEAETEKAVSPKAERAEPSEPAEPPTDTANPFADEPAGK